MTDPRTVRRELARLAGVQDDDEALVLAASDAVGDVARAATLLERTSLDRLARATAAADDPALTRRGQRALAAVQWYRRAASAGTESDGDAGATGAGAESDGDAGATDARTPDHFHSGRGTDLRGERQWTGR